MYWLSHCATSRKVPGSIPVVSLGIFSLASGNPMCPLSTKNEYHDTPGGKDCRCIWLTTYHVHDSRRLGIEEGVIRFLVERLTLLWLLIISLLPWLLTSEVNWDVASPWNLLKIVCPTYHYALRSRQCILSNTIFQDSCFPNCWLQVLQIRGNHTAFVR
jgi:hypothetical protein